MNSDAAVAGWDEHHLAGLADLSLALGDRLTDRATNRQVIPAEIDDRTVIGLHFA